MIAKTFVTAFMAASFMAGSHASPCKVSSKTTDISTTVEISSAAASTEASGTTEAISSATDISSAEDTTLTISQSDASSATSSSEGVTTTTAVSTTDLSTTIVDSSTETSTAVDGATTTAVSTTEISSTILQSSTETSAISEGATTTTEGTTTAEITTTAESTTTTAEAPPAPTFVANAGFDGESDTTAPWAVYPNAFPFSISSTTKYEGRNSAEVKYTTGGPNFIRQPLGITPQAGVGYPLSAWVRPASGCDTAYIFCTYSINSANSLPSISVAAAAGQWIKVSGTCTYTQAQINSGGLYMYVGFECPKDATVYIDSVTFDQ